MTEDPERREEHPEGEEVPADEATFDPVRITGAHRAADLVAAETEHEDPSVSEPRADVPRESGPPTHEIIGEHVGAALQHWTEPPTGQVPAVVARSDADDVTGSSPAVPEPTWREEKRDWDRVEAITPSLLAEHDAGAMSLNEGSVEERQPWEFEIPPREEPGDEPPGATVSSVPADLGESVLFETWTSAAPSGAPADDEETVELVLRAPEPPRKPEELDSEPVAPGDAASGDVAPGTEAAPGEAVSGTEGERPDRDADVGRVSEEARAGVVRAGLHEEDEEAGPHEEDENPTSADGDGSLPGRSEPDPRALDEAGALAADVAARGGRRVWRPMSVSGTSRRRRGSIPPATRERARGAAPRGSKSGGRNIAAAIGSGVVVGVLVLIAFSYGSAPAMVVVTVGLALGAAETYGAFRRAGERPATLLGIAAVVGLVLATYSETFQALPIVAVLLVGAVFLWHLAGVDRGADPVRSASVTLFVFAWVGILGSFAALLLSPTLFPHRSGVAYLLGAIVASVAYDVGALAAGRAFGRHPLASVSPGKTWEGLAGGTVLALALAIGVVRLVHPWTLPEVVVLGIVVSVVSPLGDLSESMVKRRLGLKDMGRLMPGHGGLLDRLDGLLFVLPATYFLLHAFGHG